MNRADEAWAKLPTKDQIRFMFGIGPAEMFPVKGPSDGLSRTAPTASPSAGDNDAIGPERGGQS